MHEVLSYLLVGFWFTEVSHVTIKPMITTTLVYLARPLQPSHKNPSTVIGLQPLQPSHKNPSTVIGLQPPWDHLLGHVAQFNCPAMSYKRNG
jgi:hypothetical protein